MDNRQNSTNINWYPGHMAKARKMIAEKYDLIDVVYELVDARIPFSSKIKDVYKMIGNKPKLLIMTKKDLCDMKYTENWVHYYENLGSKVILVDLNDPKDYQKIVEATYEIMEQKQQKREENVMKRQEIRVLVVGIPNVGKSTLINRLCGKKVTSVENKPGITKTLNWVKAKGGITLLDSPGILWPKLDQQEEALNLAAFTAIREEVLPIDDVAVHILKKLYTFYPMILKERYGITNIDDFEQVYTTIGKKIGAVKNGEVDYNRVSRKIVHDIKQEIITNITFDNN